MNNDPNTPDVILGSWFFLSSRHVRENTEVFTEHNIKRVIDLSNLPGLAEIPGVHYTLYQIDDRPTTDLSGIFNDIHQTIDEGREEGTSVLVHCNQGISRSAAIVMSYLIAKEKMTLKEAWHYVKSRRRVAHPNDGYVHCS
jgi:protein-tyrosine phosphatase